MPVQLYCIYVYIIGSGNGKGEETCRKLTQIDFSPQFKEITSFVFHDLILPHENYSK